MKRRPMALTLLGFIGVLAIVNAILGNIVANLLQDKLGDYAWVIVVPFVVIAALLLGFDLRDRLQEPRNDRQLTIDRHNRQAMLEKVRTIWITGVLQRSLTHEVLIDLDLVERPTAVEPPLELLIQRPDRADRALPPGTQLVDVFDEVDRALLILGAPGAGKTTLLLTLARDLLIRAAQDPEQPIPVVFPLSSWAQQRRPLVDWLVDALNEQYDVPRKISQAWIDADQILPLLDGLDEVKAEHRAACVESINCFRQEHGLLPLVVCCRITDYETLGMRPRLQGALVVQPLTRAQVESYLTQVGQPLAAVRVALRDDPALWELLDTPLMLAIVSFAWTGEPVETLRIRGTPQERRQQLFATYVDRMFQRRSAVTRYTRQQTERWLAWLAGQLTQHSQTVFYLERMQPDWLPTRQRWVPTGVTALSIGMAVALIGALITEELSLISLLMFALIVFGFNVTREQITCSETVYWSWSSARSGLMFLAIWVLLWLGVWLALGVFIKALELYFWLSVGLSLGVFFMLLPALFWGLSSREVETTTVPNEGIRRSAWTAIIVGLSTGWGAWVFFPLLATAVSLLDVRIGRVVSTWAPLGVILGVLLGLKHGGRACLQHLVLRGLLVYNDAAPWHYAAFLDYAAERVLLRKVGGGYTFIHRLLQDYFAARYTDPGGEPTREASGQALARVDSMAVTRSARRP